MSMVINQNIPAITAYGDLATNRENLAKAIKKFSSGFRVNSAADDAAGLAVSEKLRAQIRGIDQAIANSQDGISLIQTADGALSETQSVLQRMRELSVQASNGTLTWQDRSYIQLEVNELREEIDRIANATQFNKKKLLNGNASAVWSSDKATTKAIIRGGLTDVDAFGQKTPFEGNYKIDILAVPGEGMVMKSKIFTYLTEDKAFGYVGSGAYYDDEGNRLTPNEAAQALSGGFYTLGLVNADNPQDVTRFTLDATAGFYTSMQQVADALNRQAGGTGYEFYFDTDAQALAVRGTDHDFRVSGAQSTLDKLFGVSNVPAKHISGTRDTTGLHFINEWTNTNDDVNINADGIYKVSGGVRSITIAAGKKVTLVLDSVNVDTSGIDNGYVNAYAPWLGRNINYKLYGESALKIEEGAEVELILVGDTDLKSGYGRAGLEVEEGSTVKIFQSEDGGTLNATGGEYGAGIGSRGAISDPVTGTGGDGTVHYNAGDIVIYGGEINAQGGGSGGGAGIGGGYYGDNGHVAIHGGKVTAQGTGRAAGIGTGLVGAKNQNTGGEILITGGEVEAKGGNYGGAGIGSGSNLTPYPGDAGNNISYGKITITGGNITAQGGGSAAGIGGGIDSLPGEITITGGTINAQGGAGGAGIGNGSGNSADELGDGGKITITGGDITATGGSSYSGSGAGIGGGSQGKGGEIVIAGGKIVATGGDNGSSGEGGGAGVGGGSGNHSEGEIYIVDGVLTAQGGYGAAGIGGGGGTSGGSYGSYSTSYWGSDGGEIYIYGGKVNATGGISGAGIGGGTFGYSGKIRVQSGLYGDTVIATRGGFDSKSDTDPMRNHKDIGHGDHILDTEDKAQGSSTDTDADIDAPGIILVPSSWNNTEVLEKIAEGGTALSEIRQLFDESGKSLLSDPQTITITRGDGTQSRVTLYSDDDLNAVVKKVVTALNGGNANATSAVNTPAVTGSSGASGVSGSSSSGSGSSSGTNAVNANALNAASTMSNAGSLLNSGASPASLAPSTLSLSSASAAVAALTATPTLTSSGSSGGSGSSGSSSSGGTSGASGSSKKDTGPIENYYTTYVAPGTATPYTSESVEGTMLFRSLPCGVDGALAFEGSREMLEALALNKIQEARENEFIVNITDAHTGKSIVSNVRVTGNRLNGVLHKNVDIEWDDMAGVEVKWDDDNKKFVYSAKEYTTYLHLAGNETVLQVGANEGDELDISIGDMSAHALGVDRVNVTSREAAGRAITLIDSANDKVSVQRAKLGAYQNRLERTMGSLTIATENLSQADSRIRDTDMAKEAMNYAKLQILAQSGSSMLTQANQLPQNVMSLMR